jgi:hypothetical protein
MDICDDPERFVAFNAMAFAFPEQSLGAFGFFFCSVQLSP